MPRARGLPKRCELFPLTLPVDQPSRFSQLYDAESLIGSKNGSSISGSSIAGSLAALAPLRQLLSVARSLLSLERGRSAVTCHFGERDFAVIGYGAIGLTTAVLLARTGARVTIYARELPPFTRSSWATACSHPIRVSQSDALHDLYVQPERLHAPVDVGVQGRRRENRGHRAHLACRLLSPRAENNRSCHRLRRPNSAQ